MKWFDILKVLGTKTGFSQLDFDNIVIEEDEDNCKRRWQESVNKFNQFEIDSFRYKEIKQRLPSRKMGRTVYNLFLEGEGDGSFIEIEHESAYDPDVPEEVYCAAIKLFENSRKTRDYTHGKIPFNETYSFYVQTDDDMELIYIVRGGTIVSVLKWAILGYWYLFNQEAPYVYVSIGNKEYSLVELNKKFREMML